MFLQHLKDSGLSITGDIQLMLSSMTEKEEGDGEALAGRLVQSGKLTPYQAVALLEGRPADLQIGAYEVLDLLGKGAMGTVYKARHRTMKRVVAVKVLAREVAQSGTFAQRFQREVETLAHLSHPNIIMAFDAGEDAAGPYLVMEFVQGRDLASEVKQDGQLDVADALACALQAARGLAYAHDQGLVHRDVKPANLMRDARGGVKVADLGLARIINPQAAESDSSLTQAGTIVGTVDYMAPEQALDSSTIDRRADIYSLGCTLFYLLTGRPMYAGTSLLDLLLQHRDVAPPALAEVRADVPDFVSAIYFRMVAKKPGDRYATMHEVAEAFQSAGRTLAALGLASQAPRPALAADTSLADSVSDLASARQVTATGSAHPAPAATVAGYAPSAPMPKPAPSPAHEQARLPIVPGAEAKGPVPPSAPQSLPRAPGKRRRLTRASGVAAALLVLAVLLWWNRPRGAPPVQEPQANQPAPGERSPRPGLLAGVTLNGGGSTFVAPLLEHWAGVYGKAHRVRIDYQAVGSGRGPQGLLDGVYLFACSDAPLTDVQRAKVTASGGSIIHVPLVLGAVVPAYNLPGVAAGQLRFTGPVLADIFLGKITKWNDPTLRVVNPGIALPELAIVPVHRQDPSGTTYTWTDYLSQVSGEWRSRIGTATTVKWPGGRQGAGNNGVAGEVSRTVGALGYVELTYALENNLHFGQIKNREGKFIAATPESVSAAVAAHKDMPADSRKSFIDAAGENSYPIVGLTSALLQADQTSNPAGRELVAFLHWAAHEGQAYAGDLNYVPLPAELVGQVDTVLAGVKLAPP
jgi:phosphate ABC transporter phosphate-binding protein